MSEYPSHPTSLREFAFIKPDILTRTADFAVKENWGENLQTLFTYLDYNFEIAYDQKLIKFSSDEGYCLWRAGQRMSL